MNSIHQKAISLGFPDAKLKVIIHFTPENSRLAKELNKTTESIYDLIGIVEYGVLIGKIGHVQLIEWVYVKDIM